jgi:hypothetical protein
MLLQALALDTKIAVLAFLRMGIELMFNPYGDWAFSHNAVQFLWRGARDGRGGLPQRDLPRDWPELLQHGWPVEQLTG